MPRVRTLAWFVAACVVLLVTWPIDAIHFDSSRDLLMARDCYELGLCDGHGPPTSFWGLYQGVLWTNAVGLLRWLGLMPAHLGYLLAGLYALVLAATLRWRNLPALGGLLLLGMVVLTKVVLWSPALFLPAMLLTTWLTLDWLDRPNWPFTLALGLLWGLTLDLYLAAGPVLLAALALGLRARVPVQTAVVAVLALAVGLVVSPGAWLGTLAFMPLHPLRVTAVVLAAIVLVVLAVRVRALDNVAILALAGVGAWLIIGHERLFQARYFMPGFGAVALWLAQRIPARAQWPVAIAAVLVVPARLPTRPADLTYSNAARLATAMTQHGAGWPQALSHAQGMHSRELAPATAIFLPYAPTPWQGEDVVVDLHAPQPFSAVPSRVDLRRATVCQRTDRGETCTPLELDPTPPGSTYPFAVRGYGALIRYQPPEVRELTLHLGIRPGARESIVLLPQFSGDACPWSWLDGRQSVMLPREATELTAVRRFTPGLCPNGQAIYDWFPPWRETPDEPAHPQPLPPLPKPLQQPVLARDLEPQFAGLAQRLAARTHLPEPDVVLERDGALERDRARVVWPATHQTVTLTYAVDPPWFVALGDDATLTLAVLAELPSTFQANPWREAHAPKLAEQLQPRPRWPHLTFAGLGLLGLLVATWRVSSLRRR